MNWQTQFETFCSKLMIDSKEQGTVPLILNGCQKYFIKEAAEIFATAAMMGSAASAVELVESVGLAGVFIRDNGDVVVTSTLKDFEP